MPRSSNKNKNSNNNKIHITINNKSSSRRKRKGKSKQGSSSIPAHHGNSMPTIIQMHQVQPTIAPTSSQVTDNRYGVGMSEKIDALSGGLTRVLENIENKQQEYYTKEKNEAYLRKQLKNREDELRVLSHTKPPASVAPLNVPRTMGNNSLPSSASSKSAQITSESSLHGPSEFYSLGSSFSGSLGSQKTPSELSSEFYSSGSSFSGSLGSQQQPSELSSEFYSSGSSFNGSLGSQQQPSDILSSGSSFNGSLGGQSINPSQVNFLDSLHTPLPSNNQ